MLGQSEPPKGKALQDLGRRTVVLPLGLWVLSFLSGSDPYRGLACWGQKKKITLLVFGFCFLDFSPISRLWGEKKDQSAKNFL